MLLSRAVFVLYFGPFPQKIPLVGHSILLDLLHSYTHFIGDLPEVHVHVHWCVYVTVWKSATYVTHHLKTAKMF